MRENFIYFFYFISINISTALTVRFLTKRYIGEYDHQADKVHKHEILVDTEAVLVEIWDTCMVSKYLILLNLNIFVNLHNFLSHLIYYKNDISFT